jgi:phage terminase large subunit-like protein
LIRDYGPNVQAYIDGVLSGSITAGKLVRMAVERHVDDLKHAGKRGLHFEAGAANAAITFFPLVLRHSTGQFSGLPFELEPWQMFVLWCIFGWKREGGLRRFRKALIEVGRKNGKTAIAAGMAHLLLSPVEEEGRPEIYCAATTERQAKLLYDEAVRQWRASPSLQKRLRKWSSPPRLTCEADDGKFLPLGSDSPTRSGYNPSAVFKDELHEWREHHRVTSEVLSTGGGARLQPLEVITTTAGDDKSEIWRETRNYAVRCVESVVNGSVIDDTMFAFIACIDDDDDPLREDLDDAAFADYLQSNEFTEVMSKANPNLGVSVLLQYLKDQANEARNDPPKRSSFLRYHCNRQTSSTEKAITAEVWARGNAKPEIYDGMTCHGAWDLGRSNDWSANALVFPLEDDRFGLLVKCFTCEDSPLNVSREPYRSWVRSGQLEVHRGTQIDFSRVRAHQVEWSEQYNVQTWAYDKTFSTDTAQIQQEEHGFRIFPFFQVAYKYNEPLRSFLRAVEQGRILHGNDPVLAWQAGNLTIVRNQKDEWMPAKAASEGKIDGLIAVLMAYSECLFAESAGPSIYEQPGNLAL